MKPDTVLPTLDPSHLTHIIHCDWSAHPRKRWMARAVREGRRFRALAPEPVKDVGALLPGLRREARPHGAVLAGFDFPIGLPRAYAARAGIADFLAWLPQLGRAGWASFDTPAETPEQISLQRPFYPHRPGGARRAHLLAGLGLASWDDLYRDCDRAHAGRRAACPLFWTLGGQQVGKAALCGWREVLVPALAGQEIVGQGSLNSGLGQNSKLGILPYQIAIWPFSGALATLLQPGRTVIAESYPAEYYRSVGVDFSASRRGGRSGKRAAADRIAQAAGLLGWAERAQVRVDPALEAAIRDGFGPQESGEDAFDAVVGLFGMLAALGESRPVFEPQGEHVRKIEGWILGQAPN